MLLTTQPPLPVRLITYNIRFATKSPSRNEKPWSERRPLLCAQLRFITADHPTAFICLQEALPGQIEDIHDSLGPEWSHIGVGRDDGRNRGEHSPIFYRTSAWRCDAFRTYWLSETPDVPSRGWDADLPRIVTVGDFSSTSKGGPSITVMCTHFDHKGVVARRESARLLLRIAADDRDTDAVVLAGDFNSDPDDEAYRAMVAPGSGMTDARDLVAPGARYGNDLTYTSFDEPQYSASRIDFLFVKDGSGATVRTFGVLANRFDDGVFLSDHRPVVADLDVSNKRP